MLLMKKIVYTCISWVKVIIESNTKGMIISQDRKNPIKVVNPKRIKPQKGQLTPKVRIIFYH